MEWIFKSNKEILIEVGDRIQNHRLKLNITQQELSEKTGLSLSLIQRVEKGASISLINFVKVLRGMQLLEGLENLIPKEEISPILLKELKGRERKRASKNK